MAKRITVAVTLDDSWYTSADDMRRIKNAMIAAAVKQAAEQGCGIALLEAKRAMNVRKPK